MPNVVYFLYCESNQNEITPQGPKAHIIAPLMVMSPVNIPTEYSFSISFGIQDVDVTEPHYLRIIFHNAGVVLHDTGTINLPIEEKGDAKLPKNLRGINIGMDFRNLLIHSEGEYATDIYLDEVLLGSYPIAIVKGVV